MVLDSLSLVIVDSTVEHAEELTRTLRQEDHLEAVRAGLDPEEAVLYSYHRGVYRKTALIDDKVAAMWGVMGTPLGIQGTPYLITSPEVLKVSSVRFAKVYFKEAQMMKRFFPVLENYVDASYLGAVRMLQLAGFTLTGPIVIHDSLFYKFTMKDI